MLRKIETRSAGNMGIAMVIENINDEIQTARTAWESSVNERAGLKAKIVELAREGKSQDVIQHAECSRLNAVTAAGQILAAFEKKKEACARLEQMRTVHNAKMSEEYLAKLAELEKAIKPHAAVIARIDWSQDPTLKSIRGKELSQPYGMHDDDDEAARQAEELLETII